MSKRETTVATFCMEKDILARLRQIKQETGRDMCRIIEEALKKLWKEQDEAVK